MGNQEFDFERVKFELPVAHSSAYLMIYKLVDIRCYPPAIWMTYKSRGEGRGWGWIYKIREFSVWVVLMPGD